MKRNYLILVLCLLSCGIAAQSYQKTSRGIQTNIQEMYVEIQFFPLP